MRSLSLLALCLLLATMALRAQDKKLLLKEWIMQKDSSIKEGVLIFDSVYTRFTFTKGTSYISMTAPHYGFPQDWSLKGNILAIGYMSYEVDELTDSTLVITEPGNRRLWFKDEQRLLKDSAILEPAGMHNGEPVYIANNRITARYKTSSFEEEFRSATADFSIPQGNFQATFIVGKDGSVSDVVVVSSILDNYDKAVVKFLQKTSRNWKPATFNGTPVQTKMTFTRKYFQMNRRM